jgi:F0F1-type ATP synthase membrane subunit b/b'
MSNPLTQLVVEFQHAETARDRIIARAEVEIKNAEHDFRERMAIAAQGAHTAGVTRYMAQKVTGAPASQVNEWFGDLPTAKPGRRRKDDPIYGGKQ